MNLVAPKNVVITNLFFTVPTNKVAEKIARDEAVSEVRRAIFEWEYTMLSPAQVDESDG